MTDVGPESTVAGLDEEELLVLRHVGEHWGRVLAGRRASLRGLPVDPALHRFPASVEVGPRSRFAAVDFVETDDPAELPVDPFYPSTVRARALKAWGWKQTRQPEPHGPRTIWVKARPDALEPLTPHEARHCAASYMIAAGMDWKKITEFLGHSDVRTTYNRYGKVVPEDLGPAAAQLDDYFARTRARLETGPQTGGTMTGPTCPQRAKSAPNSLKTLGFRA
ncbi:MAG: tyrosine-type recombinase/integrase [Solirubrobacteraceae bacterium]